MKKTLPVLLALLLVAGFCRAQEEQSATVCPDRPGALTGPEVMPLHKLQWETGVACESQAGGPRSFTLNNTLLRYGLFRHAEIRLGTDLLLGRETPAAAPAFGVTPLCFGLKAKFYEGSGVLPAVALLAQLSSPHIGTRDLLPQHLAPSMYLLFEHSLGERLSLGYNVGAEWDGDSARPACFLGLGLYLGITDSVGAFLESYNYLGAAGGNRYMTEFGLSWLVSRRVQLDLSADLDFRQLGKYWRVSCGVAWLIN